MSRNTLGSKELVFSLTEILLEVDIIGFLMRGLRGMVGMECFLIGTESITYIVHYMNIYG